MMFITYQPNNKRKKADDCVIRAICKATGKEWLTVFDELTAIARKLQVMPNEKPAYEKYLKQNGFTWCGFKAVEGKKRYTVADFARLYKGSIAVVSVAHHLVAVGDGNYYDIWDCGNKSVYGYYCKKEC